MGTNINITSIAANHSQITIAVAGLAFTILLLSYPLFISRSNDIAINSKVLSIGLAFFFFSLVFGLLASFEYSVVSGDKRPDIALMVTWTFPSLAFGICVTTLFAGFVHIAGSYSSTGISIDEDTNRIIKSTSTLVCVATVFFITRTNYESFKILVPNQNLLPTTNPNMNIVILIIFVAAFGLIKLMDNVESVNIFLMDTKRYFQFLSFLVLFCMVGYAYTSALSFPSLGPESAWWLIPATILMWLFTLWTAILLPKLGKLSKSKSE